MKKSVLRLLALLMATLLLFGGAIPALAAPPVDTKAESSLTLVYKNDNETFEGVNVSTYRIADVFADSTFELCEPFNTLPVSVDGITSQEQWNTVCETIASYVTADGIIPTYKAVTNENGEAKIEKLTPGLFLTLAVKAEKDGTVTKFESFITAIPTTDENDDHIYDVTAYPKSESYTPSLEEITYKVVKQWSDSSFEHKRPSSVKIDILKDGALSESVTLSKDNNWSYSWTAPDDGSTWQAVERNVPEGYTVSVTTNDKTIIVTNSYTKTDSSAPQTGYTFVLWPYVLLSTFAGGIVILIAIYRKRAER